MTNPTSLDREAREAVPIQLLATDRGAVSLVSNLTIRVVLGDINDNTPMFSQSSYTASVPEVHMLLYNHMYCTACNIHGLLAGFKCWGVCDSCDCNR